MTRRAFTLIELLVVIAIIGLLSTVAVVSLSSTRKQARNVKRVSDVRQLVTAFNLALDANGSYPSGANWWHCISASCYGGWAQYNYDVDVDTQVDNFFKPYLTPPPVDPNDNGYRGQGGYVYSGTGGSGFPVGHLIAYTLETPAVCGPGFLHASFPTYIRCVVNLDQ